MLFKVRSCYNQGALVSSRMGGSHSRSYNPNSGQCRSLSESGNHSALQKEYVESVVCNESDLKENEMKVFDVGTGDDESGRVLVIKQKGVFSAVGTKCTHYGGPLVNGALGDGRVRCPWHGACFNIKTGDIEDFPGFDSLPCYQVTVTEKGEVKVRAKISDLKSNVRTKDLTTTTVCDGSVIVIVGGGPSGATCAETLRGEGFSGRIIVVCKENYLPYDRIKVSKIGMVKKIEDLQARSEQYYNDSKIEILKGVEAINVDTDANTVTLSDGIKLQYNVLYLATGSSPRVPQIPGIDLHNIFTVRNFDDSVKILNTLGTTKSMNVVVLGLSFIGLEIAASCSENAKSVTVVGHNTTPLGHIFGTEIGRSLQKLFEDKGVKFQFETTINRCEGEKGMIKSVVLDNGKALPADMLIMGVGTTFNTDFLKYTSITMEQNGAVTVDNTLKTSVNNVFAGGDIACAPVFAHGDERMSIGHIGLAQYHGRIAACNMLNKKTPLKTVPFFWTTVFGKSIRYAGCGKPASTLVDGDVSGLKFVIFFFDESDKVIAVASCMRDPVVAQFAEYCSQGKSLYKADLEKDLFAWTKNN